jgi:type I restriction enzyme S subunit
LNNALERLDAQRREILATAVSGELMSPAMSRSEVSAALSGNLSGAQLAAGRQSVLFGADVALLNPPEGTLGELPQTWRWVRVDQVGEVRLGRQRSPEHHHGEHLRPYLRVANVYEDHIDTSDVHEMNFKPDEFVIFALEHGDILLNEGQSMELVGRPALFRDELPGACFQNTLIRFRSGPAVDAEFALLVFMHYLHSGQFRKVARGSTNIAHLGLDRFRSMPFPLPPLEQQKSIVKEARRRLDVCHAQAAAVQASIDRLPQMERELLAAAVAGELARQDLEDESAAQLLERLGEPIEIVPPQRESNGKGATVQPPSTTPTGASKSKFQLCSLLKKAGRPMPLPELFALAGLDRDQPEHVELFYLALRFELGSTIRQVGDDAENAMLEVNTDAPC